jgi:hypothetical protein
MNRRIFLKALVVAAPVAAVIANISRAQTGDTKPAAGGTKPPTGGTVPAAGGAAPAGEATGVVAKESDPMPKSLNYCENADKGKAKVCPTRKEPARAKQYCEVCQFYKAAGKKGKDNVGNCQILQNNLVKAKGWCNSFVQKA